MSVTHDRLHPAFIAGVGVREGVMSERKQIVSLSEFASLLDKLSGPPEIVAPLLAAALKKAKADGWDEGAARATPHGGGYLRSFYAENPYRGLSDASGRVEP